LRLQRGADRAAGGRRRMPAAPGYRRDAAATGVVASDAGRRWRWRPGRLGTGAAGADGAGTGAPAHASDAREPVGQIVLEAAGLRGLDRRLPGMRLAHLLLELRLPVGIRWRQREEIVLVPT